MALLIVLTVLFNLVAVGGIYTRSLAWRRAVCPNRQSPYNRCSHWHEGTAATIAFFWPVFLPMLFGSKVSTASPGEIRKSRDEHRRDREMAEAEHKAKLARLKADEHAALDRELALLERKKELA